MNTLSFLLVVQFIGFSYFANATASLYMELPKRIERAYYMSPDLRFKVNSANDYSILDTKENNEIVCDNHILRGAEIQWSRDNLFGAISLPINGKRSVYIVDVRNHTCSLKYTGSNSVTLGKFSLDSLTYAFTVPNKNELYVNNLSSNTKHKLELVHNLREEKVAQITNDDIFLVESSTYSKPSRVVIIDRKTFQQVGEFTGVPF
ncbi:MAG: hypothetical protein IPK04_06935 [Bdellovibrionales bacterium]|nr:hypothetical protein [Bdellovibrionales bacterium]